MAERFRCRHTHGGDVVFERLAKSGNDVLVTIRNLRQRERRIAARYLWLVIGLQLFNERGNRNGPDTSQCIDHCLQKNRITVPKGSNERRHGPFANVCQRVGRRVTHRVILVIENAYQVAHNLIRSRVNLAECPGSSGSYRRVLIPQSCIQIMRALPGAFADIAQRSRSRLPYPGVLVIKEIRQFLDGPRSTPAHFPGSARGRRHDTRVDIVKNGDQLRDGPVGFVTNLAQRIGG